VNNAALQSSQTAQQALDWYTQQYANTQPQRDAAFQTQQQIAAAQLAAQQQSTAQAQDYSDYSKATFRPLEQSIVSDAASYNTPERQQAAADQATADVRQGASVAQTASAQNLARMGYDPTQNASKQAAAEALAESGAATNARTRTEATGHAMEMDAASLGRNLPSAQTAAIQTGVNAGNAAGGANVGGLNVLNSGAALMGAGYGTALQGYGTAGQLYGQSAQLSQQDNSGLWGAIGSLGGAAISRSSKKVKTSGADMPDEVALDAVNAEAGSAPVDTPPAPVSASPGKGRVTRKLASMSNQAWKYHPGVEDGAVHVGPYAEEAHAKLGNHVAPGGKKIDMHESADMNGKAIAELSARVKKLSAALGAR
jgi:hypothetical protein